MLWSCIAHYRCAGQIDEAPSFGELSSTAIKSPYQSVRVRQSYSPERQTLRIVPATGDAFDVSGTYTLTMAGHTTAPIRYNASEDEFRGVLEDMHTTRCDYLNDDSPTQRMYVVGLTVLGTHTPSLTSRVPTVSTWTSSRIAWNGPLVMATRRVVPWAKATVESTCGGLHNSYGRCGHVSCVAGTLWELAALGLGTGSGVPIWRSIRPKDTMGHPYFRTCVPRLTSKTGSP